MWTVKYLKEVFPEIGELDGSLIKQVFAGIRKVSQNPLSKTEGGYGNTLGHHNTIDLTGFFKIKYKKIGIRVVYTLVRTVEVMNIVVISERDDDICYKIADDRRKKYGENIFKDIFCEKHDK